MKCPRCGFKLRKEWVAEGKCGVCGEKVKKG